MPLATDYRSLVAENAYRVWGLPTTATGAEIRSAAEYGLEPLWAQIRTRKDAAGQFRTAADIEAAARVLERFAALELPLRTEEKTQEVYPAALAYFRRQSPEKRDRQAILRFAFLAANTPYAAQFECLVPARESAPTPCRAGASASRVRRFAEAEYACSEMAGDGMA